MQQIDRVKKTIIGIIIILGAIVLLFMIMEYFDEQPSTTQTDPNISSYVTILKINNYSETDLHVLFDSQLQEIRNSLNYTGRITLNQNDVEGKRVTMAALVDKALFTIRYEQDEQYQLKGVFIGLRPELTDFYHQVGFFDKPATAVVVYPSFTEAAYGQNGFYDYYNKKCDSKCLTVNIPDTINPIYQAGGRAFVILTLLHYDYITDIGVDRNPDILKKYDKVILLHNEYVTQKEFDAITSHPNVLYLYPNALYAKIKTDYVNNTFSLIRGHNYPDPNIANGFDWKFDNSRDEYNLICNNWKFKKIDNGNMLNCYPAFRLYFDQSLLRAIFE